MSQTAMAQTLPKTDIDLSSIVRTNTTIQTPEINDSLSEIQERTISLLNQEIDFGYATNVLWLTLSDSIKEDIISYLVLWDDNTLKSIVDNLKLGNNRLDVLSMCIRKDILLLSNTRIVWILLQKMHWHSEVEAWRQISNIKRNVHYLLNAIEKIEEKNNYN